MEEVFSLSPLEYFCLCDSAPCRYDSVTSSVSRSLICSDVICHLLAHNADTHCHIVISISGGVEACCSSSFLLVRRLLSVYLYIRGVCAVHTTRTHCLLCPLSSWVRSWRNYPVKLERKWRGNTLRWYYLFTRRKKKRKTLTRYCHILVVFFFFGLSVSCWFKRLSRCGSLLWGPSCGANHFRVVLLHMSAGLTHLSRREGGAVHAGWTETTRWFCPEVKRVFTE